MRKSVLTLSGVMFASLLIGCSKKEGADEEAAKNGAPPPSIATMTLSLGNKELEKSYPVIIRGKNDTPVRPQVQGYITAVHVDEGQHVKAGQPLFTLDQVQYQAAVDQALSSVQAAQTAVKTAEMTATSKKQLYDKDIISELEWLLADNQLQTAKAQLNSSRENLKIAQKNLSFTTVTATTDGVVGSIPFREGYLASPSGQPLTTVSDNSEVYAYFSINEKDLLDLTGNGERNIQQAIDSMPPVLLRLANGTMYTMPGKVSTISGVTDNATGSASVRVLFENPSGVLRSGSTGNIVMPLQEDNVIIIPQSATFELQDQRFVFVVDDSNTVKTRPITVNPLNDGKSFVVTSGLNPGEKIVIEGVGTSIRDGMQINPVEKSDTQAAEAQK